MNQKKRISLLTQTVLFLVVLIIPLNIASIYITNTVIRNSRESLITSISMNLENFMKDLDDRMELADYQIYTAAQGSAYSHFQQAADKDHHILYRSQLFRELEEISLVDAADGMFFYNPDYDDFLYVDLNTSDVISQSNAPEILRSLSYSDIRWHLWQEENVSLLVRIIQRGDQFYGAVISCTQSLPDFHYDHYTLEFSENISAAPGDKDFRETWKSVLGISDNRIICSAVSSVVECVLTFSCPMHELTGNIESTNYQLFFFILLCILIVPVLIFVFRRKVSRPLDTINRAHEELLQGHEDYRITELSTTREFAEAYAGFNRMAQTLQELRLEKINRELAYKQMQLNNLQLQIRPHFLLNMMNLLYMLVHGHETEEAQELVLYLSRYFRYMFRSGKELELFDKELSLIQEYLHISQFHFPNAFRVSYQIDSTLSLLRIPPLLLHNFVENIIQHALVQERTIHIILYGEYEEGMITLQISDDGRGMPKADVELINAGDFSRIDPGKHIGIRNSITRLKYYYGEEATVTAESEPDAGTTFTIRFPYDLEGDLNEFVDCE